MKTIPHEIKVSVDEDAVARAAATIREAGKQLHETLGRLEGYAVEPWEIYSPVHECTLTAYLDDYNQIRHVKPEVNVPESWRKIYVQKKLP
jgi:predicted HAD superfamily Cof-like phosphohydrolase